MSKKTFSLIPLLATMALSGCSEDSGSNKEDDAGADEATAARVEMFSWWIAPGEAEALQAVVDLYRSKHPDSRVYNAAEESGAEARDDLATRLDDGDPPDVFQLNAHDIGAFVADNPGGLERLETFFDDEGLNDVVFPEIIDDVTVGGQIVAMPVNIHRENSLFYNVEIFDRYGLTPPTTPEQLIAVCDALLAEGVTPIATSYQGWIQRIMFNSLAAGSMGADTYHDYYTGKLDPDSPELRTAMELYATILENYINDDAGDADFGWTQAADAVFGGDAAMFLHGDWAKGYLVQLGWTPGDDFGVVAAPGSSELFLYGVDIFAIPKGAKNEQGALDFLSVVASKDGQVAFNRIKGSSPMRSDITPSTLDALGRKTLADLENAEIRMLVINRSEWDEAFTAFTSDRDIDALYEAFQDAPPPAQ